MDYQALARQLDEMLGQPPGTTTPEDVERILAISKTPTKPGLAERRAATIEAESAKTPALPVFPKVQEPEGSFVEVDVEGMGTLQFPSSMSQDEIKEVLDRTIGPNRPRSDTPLLQDLFGAVAEPARRLEESLRQPRQSVPRGSFLPVPGGLGHAGPPPEQTLSGLVTGKAPKPEQRQMPPLADPMALAELATAVPWGMTGRAAEHAWERGASAVTGTPRESTWPSTIAGFVGGGFGPSVVRRGLGRLVGRGVRSGPPGPAPGPSGPAPGPKPRIQLQWNRSGPTPVLEPRVPGLQGAKLTLGQRLISPETPVLGPTASFLSRMLTPVYSRMEALGPEGFEAARLLRRTTLDTMGRTARDVQPLVDEIKRLSRTQKRQLYEHLHKGAEVTDPGVAQAAQAFATVFGPQGTLPAQMRTAGLQLLTREGGKRVAVGPFQTRAQFFPLEYPGWLRTKIAENAKFVDTLAEEMVRTGQAPTISQAQRIIRQFIEGRKMGVDRPSPGEYARQAEIPGFITDPAEAVMLRGWKTSRRLAEIEHLGRKDAKLEALVSALRAKSPEQARQLQTYIDIALGGQRGFGGAMDAKIGQLARTLRSAQAFFKLPLAIIPNLSQSVWTAFRTDARATLGALTKHIFRRKESVRTARELGAYTDVAARQLMQEYASEVGERVLGQVLRPFNSVERFNRVIAANAGQAWAKRLEAALVHHKPTKAPRLYRELRRLGFADDEARLALTARRLSADQHKRIALEIVDQTQFIPSKAGRSEFFNSELGSTLGQFKTFSMNLARMLNRAVVDEMRAGNYTPAARLLFYAGVPMQVVGELVADARAVITGRQRPTMESEFVLRVIENFTSVGAVGIATDAIMSITSGRSLATWIAGPTADDLDKLLQRIVGLAGADTSDEAARQGVELGRFAVRRGVPYLGPALTTHTLPPTVPAPGFVKNPTPWDLLGVSPRARAGARTRKTERQLDQRERWLRYKQLLSR